jgi:hypothetical protein
MSCISMECLDMKGVQHCLLQHSLNSTVSRGLEGSALLRSYSSTKAFSILIDAGLRSFHRIAPPRPIFSTLPLRIISLQLERHPGGTAAGRRASEKGRSNGWPEIRLGGPCCEGRPAQRIERTPIRECATRRAHRTLLPDPGRSREYPLSVAQAFYY